MKTKTAAVLTLLCCSCATLSTGRTSKVHLRGRPGTAFETSTGIQGHVPATVTLPNGQAISIRYDSDRDGSLDAVHQSLPAPSGASVGNLVFGGLLATAIDASNPNTKIHKSIQTLGRAWDLTLSPEIREDLRKHGVTAEEFVEWPEYRAAQAEVNLSYQEYEMWRKYNDLIRSQYEQEAQKTFALVQANKQGEAAPALDPVEGKAATEREAQLPRR